MGGQPTASRGDTLPQIPAGRGTSTRRGWGRVPAYAELAHCTRRLAAGDLERRYVYILCRERTPHGAVFFYMKSRVETWREGQLAGEDFAVQRLAVRDDEDAARATFRRVTASRAPISPIHLTDILRDLAVLAAERPARWPRTPKVEAPAGAGAGEGRRAPRSSPRRPRPADGASARRRASLPGGWPPARATGRAGKQPEGQRLPGAPGRTPG